VSHEKLEPLLQKELARADELGDPERTIPVLIEHVTAAEIEPGRREEAGAQLDDLARRVRELQEGIVARLAELGAGEVKQAALANALSAGLTPAQILAVAERDDVKLIRLDREEVVTA
jgi:hypothetical protein